MPRFSSQKVTFDLPDIGPTSISCSRPTRLAGIAEYTAVHQLAIALLPGLDHGGRVDAGGRAEGIAADTG
jgi:hypothetical protein